mmetsp:Transcript_2393/g.4613  ORF Transcript_2393/g.4613 Transcript_2393/m.4613 type:complete len:200 (-) Transcript_2393:1366-1965(-)
MSYTLVWRAALARGNESVHVHVHCMAASAAAMDVHATHEEQQRLLARRGRLRLRLFVYVFDVSRGADPRDGKRRATGERFLAGAHGAVRTAHLHDLQRGFDEPFRHVRYVHEALFRLALKGGGETAFVGIRLSAISLSDDVNNGSVFLYADHRDHVFAVHSQPSHCTVELFSGGLRLLRYSKHLKSAVSLSHLHSRLAR